MDIGDWLLYLSEYDPYDVVGGRFSFALKVTVPQFGHIAMLSGISFPHRSQVFIACLSFFKQEIQTFFVFID